MKYTEFLQLVKTADYDNTAIYNGLEAAAQPDPQQARLSGVTANMALPAGLLQNSGNLFKGIGRAYRYFMPQLNKAYNGMPADMPEKNKYIAATSGVMGNLIGNHRRYHQGLPQAERNKVGIPVPVAKPRVSLSRYAGSATPERISRMRSWLQDYRNRRNGIKQP